MSGREKRMRRWMILGSLCLIFGMALCWAFGSIMVRPGMSAGPRPDGRMTTVMLRATDGVDVIGSYWPAHAPRVPAILLLHGNGASRSAMADQARWLNERGYAVLAIDFRGHGQSQQRPRSFGLFEARDAHAAFDWLKRRQHGAPVGVLGISLGGAASLVGTDGPVPASCLVLQAVYPDIRRAIRNRMTAIAGPLIGRIGEPFLSIQSLPRFGAWPSDISPIRAVRQVRAPVLVIGGDGDRYTPPEETRALFDAAPGEKHLWLVPHLDHEAASSMDDDSYRQRIGTFFDRCLRS
jgi:alpha-beta hydrolase superfamily lysophospholipase